MNMFHRFQNGIRGRVMQFDYLVVSDDFENRLAQLASDSSLVRYDKLKYSSCR